MWGNRFAGVAGVLGIALATAPTEPPPGAEYEHPVEPFFTRDVDVLPEGYRLENWGASCGIGHQSTVSCTAYGRHGFVISALYGELW